MLGLRLLWRNWRGGELRILSAALVLAITVVSAVSILTQRLENALQLQGQTLLAANRVIQSSQPIAEQWLTLAGREGVATALTAEFASMVFAGEEMHLASVKAVNTGYPLLGKLRISKQPFATGEAHITVAEGVPARGEVWVDSRLLPMLGVQLGDFLEVGESRLKITQVVIEEPDRGGGFSAVGARVMMNMADMAATGVVQPGSRVRYRLLLAAPDQALQKLMMALTPQLTEHQRILNLESSQRGLSRSLDTGRKFLLLSAMMAVLLAGVAIAMAGRAFAERQTDQVALLKSLGASRGRIAALYAQQLLSLALLASLTGLLLGELLQRAIAISLADLFPVALANADWQAYMPGLTTGLVCLLCFTVPPMWHLPAIPPVKILRRELPVAAVRYYLQALLGLLALLILVALFSADMILVAATAAATVALLIMGMAFAAVLLRSADLLARLGPNWRLAMGAIKRSHQQSVIQIVVFGLAVMLLLTLAGLKTSLIEDWQRQLPADAPNHFLYNIAQSEIEGIAKLLHARHLQSKPFYPMVRARLTHINQMSVQNRDELNSNVLRREVNLSWAQQPGDDNRILRGVWWGETRASVPGNLVSVEAEVARELGIRLGDSLRFSVGGLELTAKVASIRSVKWESMNPNFYFLLSPGALDSFSPMALTSVHIPETEKLVVNDILQRYPTVVVIEMDRVIAQIQDIVNQVSQGVAWMLWVILVAGFLVMWAAVSASMEQRLHEVALLRAIGSGRGRIFSSLWIEFSLLGLFAGLMAMVGAELMLWTLQNRLLDVAPRPHWLLWLSGLLAATITIGAMGVFACRKVVITSPARVLQALG